MRRAFLHLLPVLPLCLSPMLTTCVEADSIVVGSKNITESIVLGEIVS